MRIPNIVDQLCKDCCGCCSCESVCPTSAIIMKKDNEGFLYPSVNMEVCVGCGRCDNACAFKIKDRNDLKSTIKEQYAIKYLNQDIRKRSQAGGSFAALAIGLLENMKDVVIYGAAYNQIYKVKHIRIKDKNSIDMLQGSKYIQSDMQGIYRNVEQDLNAGLTVMFTGTPCQNHAVKQFLEISHCDTSKLFLMDFICEGVASPRVWEKYIESIEERFKGKVEQVVFRNKKYGWVDHYETIRVSNYKRLVIGRKWTNCFYDSLFFRECCHNCRYTSQNRESDITVSWFGNVERKKPGFDDGYGVSGVMINTEKGKEWFELIRDELEIIDVSMDDLMQKQLQYPIEKSKKRDSFWEDFEKQAAWKTLSKYDSQNTLKKKMIKLFKNVIQRKLKWI